MTADTSKHGAGYLLPLMVALLAHAQAEAYELLGYRWPGSHPRVPYYVSTNLQGRVPYNAPFEDGVAAITNAANTWNTQGASNLKFFYAGTTEVTNVANDGINAVIYNPEPCPYAGTGCTAEILLHHGTDASMEGFDIVLYGSIPAGFPVNWKARLFTLASEADIWSVVLHELGHAAGLAHSTFASIMGTGCNLGCAARSLDSDDRDGLQSLYGPYTNDGIWSSNSTASPGDTVALFLDYPRSARVAFQIVADFDGLSAWCPLRTLWGADSRIFPLDSCPDPATGRWKRTPLERLVVPVNTGVLDGNGRAQVSVQIPQTLSCFPTNRRWFFSAVVYNPSLDPSGIEDVGVAVALDIQPPTGPQLFVRRSGSASSPAELRWAARSNFTYQVERSTTLSNWTALGPVLSAPPGGGWLTNGLGVAQSAEFFRVRALPPPDPPCSGLLAIVVSTNYLFVPERDRTTFTIRLNQPPGGNVELRLSWTSGDTSLSVFGSAHVPFNDGNWNLPQPFTISARPDADSLNGVATFTLTGDGLEDVVLTVEEVDDGR